MAALWQALNWSDVQGVLSNLLYAVIAITLLVLIRFFTKQLLEKLSARGIITGGMKEIILRITDFLVIAISAFSIAYAFRIHELSFPAVIVILVLLILNWRTLREFTAYLELSALTFLRDRHFDIYLGSGKTISAKIIEVKPMSTTLEDISGNIYYIANTRLSEAIFVKSEPGVWIKVTLRKEIPASRDGLDDLLQAIADIEHPVLRLDGGKTYIERISGEGLTLTLFLRCSTASVRFTDIAGYLAALYQKLQKYDPVIEVHWPRPRGD